MKNNKLNIIYLLACLLMVLSACKEELPEALTVSAIEANGTDLKTGDALTLDLNGITAAVDVPLDAVITINFNKALDPNNELGTNVSLNNGSEDVALTLASSGSILTITPMENLDRGIVYILTLGGGLLAEDNGLFSQTTRTFTAAGRAAVTPPQSAAQMAYFKLDGDANSSVGNYEGTEIAIEYGLDRFGDVGSAAMFDGDVSIIEVPNGDQLLTDSWTLSYWLKVDPTDHVGGHFVMGIGDLYGFFIEITGNMSSMKFTGRYQKDNATTIANDFFINADGKDANNGGWEAIEFEADLRSSGGLASIFDQEWAHMVITYNGETNKRSLYLNGQLIETDNLNAVADLSNITGLTFDDSGSGSDVIGNALALGFNHDRTTTHWSNTSWGDYNKVDANHFKGAMDDVRFFEAAYSEADVLELYNAEKP
ncbi:MAG: LamG-like jellyroll fold domain-containing protein [Bacteroidota bacterium]